MPELLKPSDVTREYGISRSSLIRYERDGAIRPTFTPGGQRRYTREMLDAMLINEDSPISITQSIDPQLAYREFGTTGTTRWGDVLHTEKIRELQGREGRLLLREMRINDPVIAAIFFAIENSLKQATWRVEPGGKEDVDKEVAKFVESNLHDMSFSWNDTLSIILRFLEQGLSVVELVYKRRLGENPPEYTIDPAPSLYNDGRVGWRKWASRPAETLVPGNEFILDDSGGIHGINQEMMRFGSVKKIPIEKLLIFRTTVLPPEGTPIHRAMYIPWWYSQNIMEIEGIGIERDLAGLPVIYLGNDTSKSGPNSDYQIAKDLVVNIRNDEQAGIVIPKPKMGATSEGNGILFELVSSGGRRQYDTSAIIERYDKRKALAVLAQFIMLGMEKVGSYALSKSQGDLFTISVSAWLDSIASVINTYAIPKLIKYNSFPGITEYPKLIPGTVGVPDLVGIASYVNTLVNNDIIRVDSELERHLRQVGGLPQAKEDIDEATGEASLKQNLPLEKAALLVRRVGLAVRSLQDLGVMGPERASALLGPLVAELEQGMANELSGGTLARQKISAPTDFETKEEVSETDDELLRSAENKKQRYLDDEEED